MVLKISISGTRNACEPHGSGKIHEKRSYKLKIIMESASRAKIVDVMVKSEK